MSESTLKFGPEWLRNLSQGTSVSSPPPSPGLGLHAPKFKLAEFRYGREEMLAIFPKDIKMPPDLKQFTGMHKEQYQLPVTLVALTEEEQKIWTRSVNSDAVLRLMGKGTSGTPPGAPVSRGGRGGGSVDRGRGRGRATYFQRGPSLEDGGENAPPGIFTRQRSYERPSSLAERGAGWEERERRYEKGFASREEEPCSSGRKENLRGNLDWRSSNQRDRDRDGEDDGGWRVSGLRSEKWGRSGWRSERGERGEHDDLTSEWPSNGKMPLRKSSQSRTWNDDHPGGDILPEWSTEDNRDAESVGTFDATGAFMETKDDDRKVKLKVVANNENANEDTPHKEIPKSHSTSPSPESPKKAEAPQQSSPEPKNTSPPSQLHHDVTKLDRSKETRAVNSFTENHEQSESNSSPVSFKKTSPSPTHKKEEVNFEHLEKAAESLVDTWTAEEDEKVDASNISSSSLSQWFYRDPQGIVQGPFSDSEMAEWFRTGYFNMSLLVRRGLDGRFCPLGELVKQWGCVPFLPNSAPVVVQPPPAPVQPPQVPMPVPSVQASVLSEFLGPTAVQMEHQNDLAVDHDQQLRLLQQQLLQQQLIQQQHLFQQQQQQMYLRQQLQQVLGGIKPTDGFPQLSSQQQQQQFFLLQRVLAQQQQHPPGVVSRPVPENNTMPDQVRQFLAQLTATQSAPLKDESQSLWNMQARTPRADMGARWSGMHNQQQTSVWDLDPSAIPPMESTIGPSHMLPEVLEQEKKLLEEQHQKRLIEEEMLRKQEEECRRRQLEEEERVREEIRRRKEEEDRIRVEELLRKQREMEERKQKEAEERKLKEQEMRRLQEEEKRRQEEREKEERLQQELFQRQEEERLRLQREFLQQEELRKQEEYRRQEEERQRMEEEKLKLEHQRELQRQLKLQQQEALKKLQKQQKSKPQAPAWGGQTAKPSDNSLSLVEIQKIQEEKERQERIDWEIQQQLIQQQMQQQQQQQAAQQAKAVSLTWANRANSAGGPVKSLLEIQQEEADKLAQEQEKEQKVKKQQQQANNVSLATAGVWSNANNHLLRANTSPSPWNFENSVGNSQSSGFWDESTPISNGSKVQMTMSNKVPDQRYAALANNTMANGNGQVGKSRMIRARKEEETVMKLFEGPTQNGDEFTKWCNEILRSMQTTIDVPTFISFLKDVESPYEVYDYVRAYLGENKETHNFAKQFLEKRSKYRNQDHKKEENMWGPAPAITPSLSKLQPSELDGPKVAGAKRKKKRMQKLDNTILGFTVHASMDRVNVGDIDHGEDI